MNVLKVTPTSLDRSDRRRDWALWIVTVSGLIFTCYSIWALWMIRDVPGFVFWLGLAAMAQVLVVITGIMALLVKRSIVLSKTEVKFVDSPDRDQTIEGINDGTDKQS